MFWTKLYGIATVVMAAALIAAPVTVVTAPPAYADCGDPGEAPCTGPVPTADEVVAIMDKLTDPGIPAATKTDSVTPGFTPDEAASIDDHLNRMNAVGLLPLNFAVTNIQPAPNNLAGATVSATGRWYNQYTPPGPIVLVDQGGHWLITHDTAVQVMDAIWYNADRRPPVGGFLL